MTYKYRESWTRVVTYISGYEIVEDEYDLEIVYITLVVFRLGYLCYFQEGSEWAR